MTLIDLTRRHTRDPATFEDRRAADNSALLLDAAATVDRYAVEFTVGDTWSRRYGPSSNGMVRIGEDGIRIPAGGSVVIEVAESIRVPYNMYGFVIPTGSLFLDDAIIIAAAKIEPAFRGQLKLRLVNSSGEPRVIKRGRKVASGIFFATETTHRHNDVQKNAVTVEDRPSLPRQVKRWIAANPAPAIAIMSAIISLLALAATVTSTAITVATYRQRSDMPDKPRASTAPATPAVGGPATPSAVATPPKGAR